MTQQQPTTTPQEPATTPAAVPVPVTYYVITIASNKDADIWNAVCYQKKPSDAEIQASDQVFRFQFHNTIVWTMTRGDLLTFEFCRRLAWSRFNNESIWLKIDLSQFDMTKPRRG